MDEKELLIILLKEAVNKCYKKDSTLIERNMEQACAARVFYYLQNFIYHDKRFRQFRGLSVDCEYYKNGEDSKVTENRPHGTKPDMIIHKRKENENNKLIVEFKSEMGSGEADDYEKLEDFTSREGNYKYSLGVFIRFNRSTPSYIYFENGEITERFDENNDEI